MISLEDLIKKSPQIILLSSEPYPFKEKQRNDLARQFPSTKIILVNGEMFSWYGSMLLKSATYFCNLMTQY